MLNASDLDRAESLLVHRRRADQNKSVAAERWDVSLYRYNLWESGRDAAPEVDLGELKDYEACMILRRREKLDVRRCADDMDVSQWWLCKMETGRAPTAALLAYWHKKRPELL